MLKWFGYGEKMIKWVYRANLGYSRKKKENTEKVERSSEGVTDKEGVE